MIRVQTEFTRQGTVRTIYYNYDDDQALVDATSVAISIVDSSGAVVVDGAAMTKTDTGIYEHTYSTTTSTLTGNYQVEIIATDGSEKIVVNHHFRVKKGINE